MRPAARPRTCVLATLALALAAALVACGPDAPAPRGATDPEVAAPRPANRLAGAASLYLRQHATNPVAWYPWSDEAFARARQEGKPIFLSIGYAACHWCHVMAEESFADPEIAALLNARYVAIKVDRHERPDVDAVYMAAVQEMTGSGGWPLSVWLTPEGTPFHGGTYFPPRAGVRGARAGLAELLPELADAYAADPARARQTAATVAERVAARFAAEPGDALPGAAALRGAVATLAASYDREHGGFGGAPKFPRPAQLELLLRVARRTGDAATRAMAVDTLQAIALGGIHDHVGGGFHRYATDAAWTIPHFEKMLSDNAQLVLAYLASWQATGVARPFTIDDPHYVLTRALSCLAGELRDPGGAFWAALDADSDGGEGRYYVWTADELAKAVDVHTRPLFHAYLHVTPEGNFEGANVLYATRPLHEVAPALGIPLGLARSTLGPMFTRLLFRRRERPAPAADRTVVAAWNGLAISAFARAGDAFHDGSYVGMARAAAEAVFRDLLRDGRLRHSAYEGVPASDALLEDYAFLVAGLLDLFEATGDTRWLETAIALQATLDARYHDDARGGYFRTADDAPALLAREKPWDDGADPSGNGVAAMNLLRLSVLTGDERHRARAEGVLRAFAASIAARPAAAPSLLAAVDFLTDRPKEVVVVAPDDVAAEGQVLLGAIRGMYLPNRVLVRTTAGAPADAVARLVPLAAEKPLLDGKATAYVCEARVCTRPTTEPETLVEQLAPVAPLPPGD